MCLIANLTDVNPHLDQMLNYIANVKLDHDIFTKITNVLYLHYLSINTKVSVISLNNTFLFKSYVSITIHHMYLHCIYFF